MLQGRLSSVAALAAALFLAACAGVDGTESGAIRENVIEPGITAIDESRILACNADASSLRTALDTYALLEGERAPDEQALIPRYIRKESELWDIVDGVLVPADPDCGTVPAEVETSEIVTSVEVPTAAEILAGFTPDEVAAFGGAACARQFAVLSAAGEAFLAGEGREPADVAELNASDYPEAPITEWALVDGVLRPTGDCNDFSGP